MAFDETPTYVGDIAADDPISANLLNSLTVQRVAFASMPAAGNTGAFCVASNGKDGDSGPEAIYWDNGSAWVFVGRIFNDSAETITGVKTFGSIPLGPASDPSTANQLSRKSYVDATAATQAKPMFAGPGLSNTEAIGTLRVATGTVTNAVLVGGGTSMHAIPVLVQQSDTFDGIKINVTTLGAAAVVRLGIYDSGADGRPAALHIDAGTIDASATGVKTASMAAQTLTPGIYWLVCVLNSGTMPQVRHHDFESVVSIIPPADILTTTPVTFFTRSGAVAGALPDPFTTGGAIVEQRGDVPAIVLETQ